MDPTSFALTGSQASLIKGPFLTAASRTYALSGLISLRHVSRYATSAPFTFAGVAASTLYGRTIKTVQGSLAWQTFPTAISVARKYQAAPQSYLLTSVAATFRRNYIFSTAKATFNAIGNPASLAFGGRVLPTTSGSFTVSGQSSVLLKGYNLGAQSYSALVSTQGNRLLAARQQVAGDATFNLSTNATGVILQRLLPTTVASFDIVLSSAYASAARRLPLTSTSFSLSPPPTTLSSGRKISIASQAFTLTHQTNSFRRTARIRPDTAYFNVFGYASYRLKGRHLLTSTSPYALASPQTYIIADTGPPARVRTFILA